MTYLRGQNVQDDSHVAAFVSDMGSVLSRILFVEAVGEASYAYARNRFGAVWVYHNDPTSPTGVILAAANTEIDFCDEVIRSIHNNSPLSPTEGLQASGATL